LNIGNLVNSVVFVLKAWGLVFVMMWVRWTLPRLRIDQVMATCLKYLLPISCFLLFGISLWEVLLRPVIGAYFPYFLAGAFVLLKLFVTYRILTTPSNLPTPSVATPWAPTVPPRSPLARN
jgi:NADH-quinone oxidoreductase subunit H